MADVKREVRALGQPVSGLKAGDNVTLVLVKQKPKVDVTPAKDAAKLAIDEVSSVAELTRGLARARDLAKAGDAAARELVAAAKQKLDDMHAAIARVKDLNGSSKKDADGAASEVKDAYAAARDGAELVRGHLEHITDGLDKAARATGAFVDELLGREHEERR